MGKLVPIYRSAEETFQADTCRPLVDAVARKRLRYSALVHGHYPGDRLPANVLPDLKSVGFWDAQADQDWGLARHRNEGMEITLLESGRMGFAVDNREFMLHPGDLTITRPWQLHSVGTPHVTAGRLNFLILDLGVRRPHQEWKWPSWIMLSPEDLKELTNALRQNEQPVWKAPVEVVRCFQAAAHTTTAPKGSEVSRLTVKLNELFVLLLEMFRRHAIPLDESLCTSRRTVELFLADLSEHDQLLAMEWTVEDMAQSCRLGLTQFFHHVRAVTNVTPMHYLNACRLKWAARLLRNEPSVSITDVSLTCGFSSSQYFATAFHRRFGLSPRNYRHAGSDLGQAR